MIKIEHALEAIAKRRGDAIVITTEQAGREWPRYSTNEKLDVLAVGCMGKASSLALGIALGLPGRRLMVLDGDGSLLMNLGTLVTIANQKPDLVHFVFENGVYETTGGQPLPGEGLFSFAKMAEAAGYPNVYDLKDDATLEAQLDDALAKRAPTLVNLRVTQIGRHIPVAKRTPAQIKDLMQVLGTAV
jgi:phosphonopyruvate decarboxylase